MPQYKVIEAKSLKLLEEKLNTEAKQGFDLVTVSRKSLVSAKIPRLFKPHLC